jgi:hypothetical protein
MPEFLILLLGLFGLYSIYFTFDRINRIAKAVEVTAGIRPKPAPVKPLAAKPWRK